MKRTHALNRSFPSRTSPRPRARQRGSILVCVLVCMSIAVVLLTTTVQATLQARRQIRVEAQLRQAAWILEAAADRAVAKLAESNDYAGETWSLAAEALPGYGPARVEIKVARTDDENDDRQIRVAVVLSTDPTRPLRRSEEFVYSIRTLPDSQ